MPQLLWITVAGVVGVLCRYGADQLIPSRDFPWATFAVNASGCFFAGWIWILSAERAVLSPELRTVLLVGFAGGFTTFSAYALQSVQLFEQGRWGLMVSYWLGSPAIGLLGAWAGMRAGRLMF